MTKNKSTQAGAKVLISQLKNYVRTYENSKSIYETREMGESTINSIFIEWYITDEKPYTCVVSMSPCAGVFRRRHIGKIELSEELLKESTSNAITAKVLLKEMKRQYQDAYNLLEKAGSLLDSMDSFFDSIFIADFSLILRDWFCKHAADIIDMETMIKALKKPHDKDDDGTLFYLNKETGVIT